jgi:hypothetical protein
VGLLATAIMVALPASAAEPRPVLAVLPFTGAPKATVANAEAETSQALSARADLVVLDAKQTKKRLHGGKPPGTAAELSSAAKRLNASLLVRGQVQKGKLHLELYEGVAGPGSAVLASRTYDVHGHRFPSVTSGLLAAWAAAIDRALQPPVPPPAVALAAPIAAAAVPVVVDPELTPATAPVTPPVPVAVAAEPAAPVQPVTAGPLVADFALGGGVLVRRLRYNEDLFNMLQSYEGTAPVFDIGLSLYPGAIFGRGLYAYLGLIGEWQRTIGFGTTLNGQEVSASSDLLAGGLRLRVPLGPSEIDGTGEYGRQFFRFGTLPGTTPSVFNYDYDFLLAALSARIVFGQFALLLGGGYIGVLENGLANSGVFPHSQVTGLDAHVGGAFLFYEVLELRLIANYQRYFFDMNSRPGDQYVAGGATDEYLSIILALAVRIHS